MCVMRHGSSLMGGVCACASGRMTSLSAGSRRRFSGILAEYSRRHFCTRALSLHVSTFVGRRVRELLCDNSIAPKRPQRGTGARPPRGVCACLALVRVVRVAELPVLPGNDGLTRHGSFCWPGRRGRHGMWRRKARMTGIGARVGARVLFVALCSAQYCVPSICRNPVTLRPSRENSGGFHPTAAAAVRLPSGRRITVLEAHPSVGGCGVC
jgi:hypothetical protein